MIKRKRLKIGEILLKRGFVTEANLKKALLMQEKEKEKRLGEILVSRGFLDKAKLQEALSLQRKEVAID